LIDSIGSVEGTAVAEVAPGVWHRLLDRQLAKRGLTPDSPPEDHATWIGFLDTVARSYMEGEQGRELLERSLAISSEEMQDLYSRQRAISACAQALLFSREDEAVSVALAAVVKATQASCGWIDVNVDTEAAGQAYERKSWVCGSEPRHDRGDEHTSRSWNDEGPDVAALNQGTVLTRRVATDCCEEPCTATFVPIVGERGWMATLVTAVPGPSPLPPGDLEVLRVVAGMLGSFSDQLESHQRLAERQAELEALVRSKDQLIASISHEIRTPLTAIMGYARLLRDSQLAMVDAESEAFVAMLVDQGDELSNIVDDLVVAARADLGHLEVVAVPIHLRAQTNQVLEAIDPTTPRSVRVTGHDVIALGDPSRVRQIIRNLITNAARYGGTNIEVALHLDEVGAHLLVVDDGRGVPDGQQDRIFEAYHRAHAVPGVTHSLGLGLFLSRTLARLMSGDVSYRRVSGQTIFDLTLPTTHELLVGPSNEWGSTS
jgi:signal transduction histidine kinase